jgi:hypothetical protein
MEGGAISNTAASYDGGYGYGNGGGVCIGDVSTFTYHAGTVTGNTASASGNAVFKHFNGAINGGYGVSAGTGYLAYNIFPPP